MKNYRAEDSLAYLADSVLASLDAANAEIQDFNGTCPEFDELPDNLQNAIYILDNIRDAVRREAMHHNVHRATHYSNGLPVRLHYKGEVVTDPEGVAYRPDNITTMHPNGTPDVAIPNQNNAA
ncbi:hypothetical protein [Corynebacterium minutissimum]|uniref:Uncharacterized protein n=1 Tax=Corynebacterium minutissimum TaxID=38301 RepID=A0A2X4RFY7_9CORY|nr:hypothetical protein [Corynebacterium minutissimum]KHO30218.1 hypothetical protein NX84_02380 [Corynebacterium minutissimum]QPS60190.1 hypothetical protein I6G51_03015 [Corynebacterium minutissimum]QQA79020.1 hypothetical protein I6H49_09835 [Corynebacterium minutissimum]SQI00981.1 Uncharacterised protein [Corynebacterium minutissimum]VEG04951.1 Uncharacterised protein [Corynebacterium minutissimum]